MRIFGLSITVITIICAGVTTSAQAQQAPGQRVQVLDTEEPPAAPAPSPAMSGEETVRYGYQIMLADVVSWLALPFQPALGMGGLALGGPVIHGLHGQSGRALISGGLRVGLTVGGAMLGGALAQGQGCTDHCYPVELPYIFGGALIGLGTAQLVDWIVLAKKEVPKDNYMIAPTASVTRDGVNIGLIGQF